MKMEKKKRQCTKLKRTKSETKHDDQKKKDEKQNQKRTFPKGPEDHFSPDGTQHAPPPLVPSYH